MIGPIKHHFDVTGHAGTLPGEISISSWIFAPENLDTLQVVPVLFCLPGGGYTKAYYHMDIPGYPNYSFAQHMTERGFIVVAIDHLGTGESTRPQDGTQITAEAMTQASHQVVLLVRDLLTQGTIAGIKAPKLFLAGIGHSMGTVLGIIQQSLYQSFDAFAPLGWANGQMTMQVNEVPLKIDEHGYGWTQRERLASFFYGSYGVPTEVIASDTALATCIPTGVFAFLATPDAMERSAAPIAVPIFFGNGAIDAAANIPDEARFYPNSPDITLFRLPSSAHCHNFAPTRALLWDRLAWWTNTLIACYLS